MSSELNDITTPFEFARSEVPLLVSMPHSGLQLTTEVESGLSDAARALPDTDWYVPELYAFLQGYGVGYIRANYSRYVIDLNRPLDDRPLYSSKTTGLFPDILFDGTPVYKAQSVPDVRHREQCKQQIWQPYHSKIGDELARIRAQFGYAILFDAHSIAAEVPMLFDGKLPDFNFGTNGGASCSQNLAEMAAEIIAGSKYRQVCNGRFKGGFITRSFGDPQNGIHAIQLELSQDTYLQNTCLQNEGGSYQIDQHKFSQVTLWLEQLIERLIKTAPEH